MNDEAPEDFPAAHSMDTTWWGVDKHGHVAHFSTGEAGAVPENYSESAASTDEIIRLLAQSPAKEFSFYADDLFDQGDGKLYLRDWKTKWNEVSTQTPYEPAQQQYGSGYLLWLRDEVAITEVQPASAVPSITWQITRLFSREQRPPPSWSILRLPTREKVIVWLTGSNDAQPPPVTFVQNLLTNGIALRGYFYERDLELERMGIFSYDLDHFDNWICGPYAKSADPPHPLMADELPAEAREQIHAVRLEEGDFLRDVLIQPFEHGTAYCWGNEWVSTTGERRETEGEEFEKTVPTPLVLEIPYHSNLVRLIANYLILVPGSAGILGDYLEESGQERIADATDAGERLDEIMVRFFSREERWLLEADFVEHLLQVGTYNAEIRETVRTAVETVRKFSRGEADSEALVLAAREALRIWAPEDEDMPERSRLAWAAWALATRLPFVTAQTCQAIDPSALQWQIELVLARLDQRHSG